MNPYDRLVFYSMLCMGRLDLARQLLEEVAPSSRMIPVLKALEPTVGRVSKTVVEALIRLWRLLVRA